MGMAQQMAKVAQGIEKTTGIKPGLASHIPAGDGKSVTDVMAGDEEGELSDDWMEQDWQRKENEREEGKPWYDVEDEDKYGQVVKLVRALQDDNTEASENTLYIIRDLLK